MENNMVRVLYKENTKGYELSREMTYDDAVEFKLNSIKSGCKEAFVIRILENSENFVSVETVDEMVDLKKMIPKMEKRELIEKIKKLSAKEKSILLDLFILELTD